MLDATGNSIFGADVTQPDRHIEGSFVDAWRRCVKVMPRTWFKAASFLAQPLVSNTADGTGYVVLPADFYALVAFKMQGWQQAVHDAPNENEKIAGVQSNVYTRGSQIRPVCVLSIDAYGGGFVPVLRYYSLPAGLASHTAGKALYIPVCTPLTSLALTADIGVSEQVAEPLAYLSASTVFTMFEKYDIAQSLEAKAVEMFPGLTRTRGNSTTTNQ